MHNVLKGTRVFSPELADQVLRRLRIDLRDLFEGEEAADIPRRTQREQPLHRTVALLDGCIGPEHPYPAAGSGHGGYPFLSDDLQGLASPVAARLAPDPRMAQVFSAGAVVLLDRSEARCGNPDEGYYALDLGGKAASGWCGPAHGACTCWRGTPAKTLRSGPRFHCRTAAC